ncbi:hypothetical protein HYC85_000904 [Camellia sinensis]|uniref:Uncharacterized protein n=1 Tax=Camellia sinensis TaxID=4442 RepID=A0A7J7I4I9_CAMSI|nr:hypothetical protein HYC85_000904 [Camellia sinensis]
MKNHARASKLPLERRSKTKGPLKRQKPRSSSKGQNLGINSSISLLGVGSPYMGHHFQVQRLSVELPDLLSLVALQDNNGGGDETERLIVDMDFRSQFELARPTSTYSELTASLSSIFVGSEEKLVEIICLQIASTIFSRLLRDGI